MINIPPVNTKEDLLTKATAFLHKKTKRHKLLFLKLSTTIKKGIPTKQLQQAVLNLCFL